MMNLSPFMTFCSIVLLLIFLQTCNAEEANKSSTAKRAAGELCPAVAKCLSRLDAGKECATLPIPERARFPLILTFTLKKLRPGVWAFIDTAYISLILYRDSKLALVDFPEASNDRGLPFVTDAVLRILKGKKPKKIEMVYSHAHYDHIGGATRFFNWARRQYPDAKIRVWGTRETRKVITKSRTKRAILPDIIIKRGAVLDMGGKLKAKLSVIGGHTDEDLVLYIPRDGKQAGIVMLVDIVFPRWAPFFNLALTTDLTRFLEVQKLVLKLKFDVFVGGHLRLGSKEDVRDSYEFGKDILKVVDEEFEVSEEDIGMTQFGNVFDPSKVEFGNLWFAFRERIGVTVGKCVRTIIKNWGCRFGGVDVTISSHCFIAVEHRSLQV